jgi:hypothetical protein
MSGDSRPRGHGPDDMGDDEQESDVAAYAQYIDDPPDDLVIAEDNDDDAGQAMDWAARHPRASAHEAEPDDKPAEESALHETRGQ